MNIRYDIPKEVSHELRDFLHYIETTDENLVENSGSDRIKKIHACVNQIKASEEMGGKYMQKWEERLQDREDGREEGRKEGRKEATLSLLRNHMKKHHRTMEEALEHFDIPREEWEIYLQHDK